MRPDLPRITPETLTSLESEARLAIENVRTTAALEEVEYHYFGRRMGTVSGLLRGLAVLPIDERKAIGPKLQSLEQSLTSAISRRRAELETAQLGELGVHEAIDTTQPGASLPQGHQHLVSRTIEEISSIFSRIGFERVRHPEADWDWYAFESLNMPPDHPARDDWETFFVARPTSETSGREQQSASLRRAGKPERSGGMGGGGKGGSDYMIHPQYGRMLLTPHTSNGQVRQMEQQKPPIRMMNIARCFRRQIDASHLPMFHQFEGLVVDRNISFGHIKGVLEYFAHQFFGSGRTVRLRPHHFQFTEPSFETDVSCGVCNATGRLNDGQICRMCKQGWLELGGGGMTHPNVLRAGGVDPKKYTGFAFGWGVERCALMKSGLNIPDIRVLYSNDLRVLNQFV